MAIVTTYVCDVSGVNGTKAEDFVSITINADNSKIPGLSYGQRTFSVQKLVHVDVARKLNLVHLQKDEEAKPEVTFESKLGILLKERIEELAYEVAEDVAQSYRNN